MKDCLFCDIVDGKVPATFVHRNQAVSVFMDIQPVNAGHMLVIPNDHATFLSDLNPDIGAEMFRVAQRMAQCLRLSGLPCEGVNMFLADGEAAMQEIFHVHLHVFPRVKGDGFGLKFGERYFQKPVRTELEEVAEMIKQTINQRLAGIVANAPNPQSRRSDQKSERRRPPKDKQTPLGVDSAGPKGQGNPRTEGMSTGDRSP